MRQNPLPSDAQLRDYYERKYRLSYKGSAEPRAHDLKRDRKRAVERLTLLAPVLKPGMRILDVGSGTGMFLVHARQDGYAVQGIEPDIGYAAQLRQKFDLSIHAGPWDTAEFDSGSFDLVVMHHVLEHLRTPSAALRRIHDWIAEGGFLYLSVPDMKNPNMSPLNRFQAAHLYGFTHETLVMTARKSGFELLDLPNTGGTHLVFRRLPSSVGNWFNPEHGSEMIEFYKQHTMLKYLVQPKAYTRFLRHIKRGLFER